MPTTLTDPSGRVTDNVRYFVRIVDERTALKLRRRGGYAEQSLAGTLAEQAADLGRTHQAMVRRRAGDGPFAEALVEVYAHEMNGRDTTAYVEALIQTQCEARAAGGTMLSLDEASRREAEYDAAEDVAQVEYHVTGSAGRWERSVRQHVAFALSHLFPAFRGHQ